MQEITFKDIQEANKTSYIENCETSAVGRALGMCGFGIDTSIASAEEVQNAMANQKTKETKTINFRDRLVEYCKTQKLDMNEIAKSYKLNAKSSDDAFEKVLELLKGKQNASSNN